MNREAYLSFLMVARRPPSAGGAVPGRIASRVARVAARNSSPCFLWAQSQPPGTRPFADDDVDDVFLPRNQIVTGCNGRERLFSYVVPRGGCDVLAMVSAHTVLNNSGERIQLWTVSPRQRGAQGRRHPRLSTPRPASEYCLDVGRGLPMSASFAAEFSNDDVIRCMDKRGRTLVFGGNTVSAYDAARLDERSRVVVTQLRGGAKEVKLAEDSSAVLYSESMYLRHLDMRANAVSWSASFPLFVTAFTPLRHGAHRCCVIYDEVIQVVECGAVLFSTGLGESGSALAALESAGGELIIAGLTSGVVKLLDDGLHLLETAAFGGAVLVLAVSVPYPRQPHFTINHSEPTTALFPDHNHN